MPAEAYLALAKHQTGTEQQSLLIMAAGRFIEDGHWQEGQSILTQTSNALTPVLLNQKNILLAKIALIQEQPRIAIATLSRVHNAETLPVYQQIQFHGLLALAYQSINNTFESISERIKLNDLLPNEAMKSTNRRALWLSLTMLPAAELNMQSAELHDGSVKKGWIQLAIIARHSGSQPDSLRMHLQQWQQQYPTHPANALLPTSLEQLQPAPRQIALLLPLTGPLSGPGLAIKDGFIAAAHRYQHTPPEIRFYDTNRSNLQGLYQQAINNGADVVVGPLSKSDVAIVAEMHHPVPTLLLNDFDDKKPRDQGYLFGLSPTNEARQIAIKARKSGLSRALIIAPAGPWGDEVVRAFSHQWQTNGGAVVETLHLKPNDNIDTSIRLFLHASNSEERDQRLKRQRQLKQPIEAIPERRQDFDVIFLLAYPSKARQIMPMLRYYYAGDVPVYATSNLYSGQANAMKDKDLDGIIFCDTPWVFNHQMGARNWPEQFNSYNRLYALGMDSYMLSNQLNTLLLFPAMSIDDENGVLYFSAPQKITRMLAFGQFKQGLAHWLSDGQASAADEQSF